MNTKNTHLPPALLSLRTRVAIGAGVVAVVAGSLKMAGQASHEAVWIAHAALNPPVAHAVLPTVTVVAPREAGLSLADSECPQTPRC